MLDKEEADSFYEKNNGKKYDVIVANILADVIIPLSGIVAPLLKDDGVFITSGIINTMEEAVKEAMPANHFEILEINHMKDWVSITAKKA
ncbi:MAG: 50S ribosomal protein L11 methyltransferase [Anaerobutyricum soehngenii]